MYYISFILAVQYNSENNSWNTWLDIFKNKIPKVSNEAKNTFVKLKEQLEQGISVDNWDKWINKNNLADKSLIDFLKDANYSAKDLANYQQYLIDTGKSTSAFTSFTKKAGAALKSFGAAMSSMAITWAIGEVIGLIAKGIDNIVSIRIFTRDDEQIICFLLRFFVCVTKLFYITLERQDEYAEYNKIVNQIAEMFPQMVQGYTNEGNAIL